MPASSRCLGNSFPIITFIFTKSKETKKNKISKYKSQGMQMIYLFTTRACCGLTLPISIVFAPSLTT